MENHKCIDTDNVEKSTLIENFQCDFKYTEHKSRTTVSCYYSTGVVIATHNESFTSALSNMAGCNYGKGYCHTHSGKHVMWKVIENVKVNFLPVGKFDAAQIDKKLFVPELSMSFNIPDASATTWIDRDFKITGQKGSPQRNESGKFENQKR
jgi:hypothetical protein